MKKTTGEASLNRKIKVLHVIKTLGLGGAETNLFNLVQAMNEGSTESHVAYSWGGEIEERFRKSDIRLFKFSQGSHRVASLATPGIVFRLARYILQNDIQIVHTHLFNAHLWGGLAARLTGRKVVEHVHDFRYIPKADREKSGYHVDQFRFIRPAARLSDGVIVLTEQNKDFIRRQGLHDAKKIRLIRNGIPMKKNQAEDEGEIKETFEGKKIFLTTARISAEKNIDLLFEIVPRVVTECPEALFVVAGAGPLLETYRQQTVLENLDSHLKFIGFRADVHKLLKMSYALLLPSWLELHPISILEALSLKVPVLVSAGVGCNSEVFTHGKNALLLDPHSPEDWARSIVKLIKNPRQRNFLGQCGFDLCLREFGIHAAAGRIKRVYQSLLKKNRILFGTKKNDRRTVFAGRIDICGTPIDNLTMMESLERIDRLIRDEQNAYIVTPNVDHIVQLHSDREFKRVYEGASLVLPDGSPLLWAARFLGDCFKEKVSGSDLVTAECAHAVHKGHRLFFLGGRPGNEKKLRRSLERMYPGLQIAGIYSPPFGFENEKRENDKILNLVRNTAPDILFVGLGTPKQEKWIYRNYKKMNVPVSVGVGASIDFVAGTVRRAPLFMQKWGLEWFWRLSQEPGRLWKRYLIKDTFFFWLFLKQKLTRLQTPTITGGSHEALH